MILMLTNFYACNQATRKQQNDKLTRRWKRNERSEEARRTK
jgi:hypothetical protein